MKELIEAFKKLQEALARYKDKENLDGPCIIIRPSSFEVIDVYGTVMTEKNENDPEEAANMLEALD